MGNWRDIITQQEHLDSILKDNILKLAEEHSEICMSSDCDVSLSLVGVLIERAGLKLSKDEWNKLV